MIFPPYFGYTAMSTDGDHPFIVLTETKFSYRYIGIQLCPLRQCALQQELGKTHRIRLP